MSKVIKHRLLYADDLIKILSPVILCAGFHILEDEIINTANYQTISLNLPLAKALEGKTENEITTTITAIALNLLPKNTPIYLIDYEMLFDPRYSIDPIKLFIEIARYNKLIVKWCGTIQNNDTLVYSVPGYQDYSRFKISDYDITVVM